MVATVLLTWLLFKLKPNFEHMTPCPLLALALFFPVIIRSLIFSLSPSGWLGRGGLRGPRRYPCTLCMNHEMLIYDVRE
jgi:hypothetical protein